MSTYDPDNWLVSLTRGIGEYVVTVLDDPDTDVEMDFPDTRNMEKLNPLPRALIHFTQDNTSHPVLGFGMPGVSDVTTNEDDPEAPFDEATFIEAAQHLVNFDVGVWVSAESGGSTKRMELQQALAAIFATAGGRKAFNLAVGVNIIGFDGGRNVLDRINDVPVWRTTESTLVVRAFSRHAPDSPTPVGTPQLGGGLVIQTGVDGEGDPVLSPVVTP